MYERRSNGSSLFCVSEKKRYNSECDWRKIDEKFTILFRVRRQGMGENR